MKVVQEIVRTINSNMRGGLLHAVVSTAEIRDTRGGNCFAFAALAGAAMLAEGVATDEEVALLITKAHGMPKDNGEPWVGHASLVWDPREGRGSHIEVAPNLVILNQFPNGWIRGARPEDQPVIDSRLVLDGGAIQAVDVAAYMGSLIEGDNARKILAAKRLYGVHGLAAGVDIYQRAMGISEPEGLPAYTALYSEFIS